MVRTQNSCNFRNIGERNFPFFTRCAYHFQNSKHIEPFFFVPHANFERSLFVCSLPIRLVRNFNEMRKVFFRILTKSKIEVNNPIKRESVFLLLPLFFFFGNCCSFGMEPKGCLHTFLYLYARLYIG